MSIGVFLLSLFFAGVQTGVCVLLQAFAGAFGTLPRWLISGGTFALGMLLSFVLNLIYDGIAVGGRFAIKKLRKPKTEEELQLQNK